jgi:hypothetical protein
VGVTGRGEDKRAIGREGRRDGRSEVFGSISLGGGVGNNSKLGPLDKDRDEGVLVSVRTGGVVDGENKSGDGGLDKGRVVC